MCLRFEIQILCFYVVNVLIKGKIEKLSGQNLSSMCDESLMCHGLNSNPRDFCGSTFVIYLVWRIVFPCLVVCR
jgi:hypothetical protein